MSKQRSPSLLFRRILFIALGFTFLVLSIGYSIAVTREKELLATVTREINQRIRGQVNIGSLDFTLLERFPAFSARLNDISITDSLIQLHHDTLFRAKSVSFQINVFSLVTGKIRFHSVKVSDAAVSVLTTKNGYCNASLSKKRSPDTDIRKSNASLPVNRFILDQVAVDIRDSSRMKFFGWKFRDTHSNITTEDSLIFFKVNGSAHLDRLLFNVNTGSFLPDKEVQLNLKAELNTVAQTLKVHHSPVCLEEQPFMLKAFFQFGNDSRMKLEFFSRSLLPNLAFSFLPKPAADRLSAYDLIDTVRLYMKIDGSLKAGSKPYVDAYFKSYRNTLTVAKRSYEQLKLLGWFTNHVDSTKINDDHNSQVVMPVFDGSIYGIPIKAQLTITDLIEPDLFMRASMKYNYREQGELTTDRFRFSGGEIAVNFLFRGPLVNYVDTVNKKLTAQLYGDMKVTDASLDQLSSGYQFRRVNGSLHFNQTDLKIDSILFTLNGNRAMVAGDASDFIAFLFIPSINAMVNLDVEVDTLNFNSFTKPVTTIPRSMEVQKKSGREFIPSTIDWMTNHVELNLDVTAGRVLYKKLVATDVSGNVLIAPDFVRITNATLVSDSGMFKLSASIDGLTRKEHGLKLVADISDANIHDVMYSFNNFGQDALTSENIYGTLNARVTFSASLDEHFEVMGNSMSGTIESSLKDGSLRNISTLQNISKYIFKNRDFSNIQFADMENLFELNGTLIDLNEVRIFSSVITLFVEGEYDFNKQKTNLLFTIPFSNLRQMNPEERMNLEAETAKKGGNIKLRVVNGSDGRLKLVPVSTENTKKE